MQPVPAPWVTVPRLGLLASARRPDLASPTERWQSGFSYQPEGCGILARGDARCDIDVRDIPYGADVVAWEPFYALTGYACRVLPSDNTRFADIARRQLAAYVESIVSAELWTGAIAEAEGYPNLWLASELSEDLTPTTGDGLASLTHGLACLEQHLADNLRGSRGMIHATPQTVTHWQGLGLLRREGNLLVTALDTIVVPGAGYDGSAPDGAPAGAVGGKGVWAYATSMVDVRLGVVETPGADGTDGFDRAVNSRIVYAQQLASASWDGCAWAGIRLDVTTCAVGGS